MSASRRSFLKATAAAAVGGVAAGSSAFECSAAISKALGIDSSSGIRPNILYINSHDTGRFTSPYGCHAPTPNLQRLAEEGVCFTQAHCVAPTCSASRASLLTGQWSHCNGMFGLVNRGFRLNNYQHHILHTLRREAGYYAALIGLQHIAAKSEMIGYDYRYDIPGNHVEQVTPAAVRFLRSRPKQPFWLEVGFFETHRPYRIASSQDARYVQPPAPIPNVPQNRQDMANFHASLERFDWGVGEVLNALEQNGMTENTLVISATDHGIAFPDMKAGLYDVGTGVHLLMRGPGGFRGGRVCDALISHIDIFPTLCDLLTIQYPDWLQGKSFLPAIRGSKDEVNDAIYTELNYHASYDPQRAARTHRYKYIRHFGKYKHPVLPDCDDGPSKTYWVQNGWGKQTVAPEELFDLTFDPNERNNLAADGAHRSVLEDMRGRLRKWMEQSDDPLLRGPVPAPHGARVTPPYEISPNDPATIVS